MQAERKASLEALITNLKASKDELDHKFMDVANYIIEDMTGDEDDYDAMADTANYLEDASEQLEGVIWLLEDILEIER